MKLRFITPLEEPLPTLITLLQRAWPEGPRGEVMSTLSHRNVQVDGRVETHSDKRPIAGVLVEVEIDLEEAQYEMPDAVDLGRGEGWVVVEKGIGTYGKVDHDDPMNHVLYTADLLGVDREGIEPLWNMPAYAGGPWPLATSAEDAKRLRLAIADGTVKTTWTVVAPAPPRPRGEITFRGTLIHYGTTRIEKGLAEIQLNPIFSSTTPIDPVAFLLEALSENGMAVIGDRERGGIMAQGGLRMHLTAIYGLDLGHSWNAPSWWPGPVRALEEEDTQAELPEARRDHGIPALAVSRKTLEVMAEGHPWAISDRETAPRDGIKQGTVVQLTAQGQPGPYALLEHGKIAARYFTRDPSAARGFTEEINFRTNRAIARRTELLADTENTDIFRLIHAEADGLPGLEIDRVGSVLRAVVTGGAANRLKAIVYENILNFDSKAVIIEAPHLRDVRQEGALPQAKVVRGDAYHVKPGDRVIVREHGLRYWAEPWVGIDVGFFPDQRENRKRLLEMVEPGQRWLNLFCHTGAFSVAVVSKGAEVVSVDLSKKYLEWLTENLELNHLDTGLNKNVAEDARTFVGSCKEAFDGIIIDPPTAAQGTAGFWSVRKDYAALLKQCASLLKPGGSMLICRNDKQQKETVEEFVKETLKGKIERTEVAPASFDFPSIPNFPEGDAFEGVWAFT